MTLYEGESIVVPEQHEGGESSRLGRVAASVPLTSLVFLTISANSCRENCLSHFQLVLLGVIRLRLPLSPDKRVALGTRKMSVLGLDSPNYFLFATTGRSKIFPNWAEVVQLLHVVY